MNGDNAYASCRHSLLEQGHTVESIALDLGYASATAFINLFKRWMGLTPDQFRKTFSAG